jgi:hypothetical protein
MKRSFHGVQIIACVVLLGSSFLHWEDSANYWQSNASLHFKVLIAALVLGTVGLSTLSLTGANDALSRLAGAAAIFTSGGATAYAVGITSFHAKVGTYVGLVAALGLGVAGLLAVIRPGGDRLTEAAPSRPPAREMPPPDRANLTEPVAAAAQAGWYEDPSGQHAERMWDGLRWTEQVR